MKNRIANESKPKLEKITIELLPAAHAGLRHLADGLGVTVKQVAEDQVARYLEEQEKERLGEAREWHLSLIHWKDKDGQTIADFIVPTEVVVDVMERACERGLAPGEYMAKVLRKASARGGIKGTQIRELVFEEEVQS